ncbi:hypothetical protein Ahy_A07g037173 isoform E [Arachis hypogaea]|uniref:Leucine-rich repeat-containing N-terminal plant-type domain-containing protein n=1 Tax=Arachis hypogaea TaxID=3818 RepID=A0A445CHZ4_ARAHY|nr:hypothetical protein Ahy_A07g037173 isoform E [Arachis hypogaea]
MKMMITTSSKLFFFSSFLALCFMLCPTEAASRLPDTEVEALKQITKTLDWDLKNIDPCSVGGIISNPVRSTSEIINVSCDCSIANDNFCHIITMVPRIETNILLSFLLQYHEVLSTYYTRWALVTATMAP